MRRHNTLEAAHLANTRVGAPRDCSGFTLIELLVTIAVIAILASLLLPSLGKAKARSRTAACASNLRQFNIAMQLYAQDHRDYFPPNPDGNEETRGMPKWVEGWLGWPGPDCTNTLFLRESVLSPYMAHTISIWQCPESRDDVVMGESRQPRVRTVSLNCFLGNPVKSPAVMTFNRLGDLYMIGPAETMTFVDEKVETINDGSFAMQWSFSANQPDQWTLRDKPGIRHRRGTNLGFADGHVEWRGWLDERTLNAPRDDMVMPGNPDILWMQQHGTWRPDNPPL